MFLSSLILQLLCLSDAKPGYELKIDGGIKFDDNFNKAIELLGQLYSQTNFVDSDRKKPLNVRKPFNFVNVAKTLRKDNKHMAYNIDKILDKSSDKSSVSESNEESDKKKVLKKTGLPGKPRKLHKSRQDTTSAKSRESINKDEISTRDLESERSVISENQVKTFKSHKLSDNTDLAKFIVYVYKRSIKFLESLKMKINDVSAEEKISVMVNKFKDNFENFLVKSKDTPIYSDLKMQNVKLNISEVSKDLIAAVIKDLNRTPRRRMGDEEAKDSIQKELYKEILADYIKDCESTGDCRVTRGFSYYLEEAVRIMNQVENAELKTAISSFLEALISMEFSKIFPIVMRQYQLKTYIFAVKKKLEASEAIDKEMRYFEKNLTVLNSGMSHEKNDLLNLIEVINEEVKAPNTKVLNDIITGVKQWAQGTQEFTDVSQLFKDWFTKVIDWWDHDASTKIAQKAIVLLTNSGIKY